VDLTTGPAERREEAGAYLAREVVACQFSVYPLRQVDVDTPVQEAIRAAAESGCALRVGNLSTLLWGDEEAVFAALRAAFDVTQRRGPAVLVATLTAGMPSDELVASIQAGLDARPEGQGSGHETGDDVPPSGENMQTTGAGTVEV